MLELVGTITEYTTPAITTLPTTMPGTPTVPTTSAAFGPKIAVIPGGTGGMVWVDFEMALIVVSPAMASDPDGKDYATSLTRLNENPGMDTILRGGDKVIIEEDRRAFVALGAAGSQKLTYFEKDSISALDAVSMMGGVESSRGDPAAVLILRHYPDRAVRSDNRGPSNARSVFVIDLTSADGLFSAGEFEVYPNDLVLVTESPVNSIQAVFRLIGSVFTISSNI